MTLSNIPAVFNCAPPQKKKKKSNKNIYIYILWQPKPRRRKSFQIFQTLILPSLTTHYKVKLNNYCASKNIAFFICDSLCNPIIAISI